MTLTADPARPRRPRPPTRPRVPWPVRRGRANCHVRCGTVGASVVPTTGRPGAIYVHRVKSPRCFALVSCLCCSVSLALGTFIFRDFTGHCATAPLQPSCTSLARRVRPRGAGGTDRLRTRRTLLDVEMSHVSRHHRTPITMSMSQSTHHGAGHAGPTPRDATSSSEHKQDSTQTSHLTSPHSHKPAPSRRPRERRTSSVSDAPAYPQSYLCTRDVQRVPPLRLAHFVPATSPAAASAPWRHRQLLPLPSPAPSDG